MSTYFKRPYARFDIYAILRYYSGFGRCDDDFVDRLSRHYSVLIFSVFVLIVSSVQFVGKPISCFTPASFTDAHITYADFVCWISDTYFVSIDSEIPEADHLETRHGSQTLRFYQYVPFILMLQTFGFFMPGFCWRNGSTRFGVAIQKYLDQLHTSQRSLTESPVYRRQLIHNVAVRLDQYFRRRRNKQMVKLTAFYLFIKVIYLLNILVQLAGLHYLMRFDLNIKDLLGRFLIYSNTVRHTSLQFPTNVLCDFIVRFLGKNKHRHTVQCVLPINVFNEKIFIFSYLWLILLLLCVAYNLCVQWIWFLMFPPSINGVRCRVRRPVPGFSLGIEQENEFAEVHEYQAITKDFSERYLRTDGMLIMRLLNMNTDLVTMNDLTDELWNMYKVHPL